MQGAFRIEGKIVNLILRDIAISIWLEAMANDIIGLFYNMFNAMNKTYEEGTQAAYKSSQSLLEEANIMFSSSKFARAYALGVLSAEELAKSFIYKCISVGLITDPDFRRDIRNHQEKIFHVIHILLFPSILRVRYKKFLEAGEHDKYEVDHSKHLGLEAFKRFYEFWK